MKKTMTTMLFAIAITTFTFGQAKNYTPEEKAKLITEKSTERYKLTESQKNKIYNFALDYYKKNDALTTKYKGQNNTDVWRKEETELSKTFGKNCDDVLTPAQKDMNKKK